MMSEANKGIMQVIHGVNPVREALKSNSSGIKKIIVARAKRRTSSILNESHKESLILILDDITAPPEFGFSYKDGTLLWGQGGYYTVKSFCLYHIDRVKVLAGSVYHIPVARVINIANTIDYLKEKEFWVCGADARAGKDIYSVDGDGNIGLVMRREGDQTACQEKV